MTVGGEREICPKERHRNFRGSQIPERVEYGLCLGNIGAFVVYLRVVGNQVCHSKVVSRRVANEIINPGTADPIDDGSGTGVLVGKDCINSSTDPNHFSSVRDVALSVFH